MASHARDGTPTLLATPAFSRRSALGAGAALATSAAGLGAHRVFAAAQHPEATPASGDVAGLVDIGGGRELYLERAGEGNPTVILEAGYRSPATVWTDDLVQPDDPRTMVLPGVAELTRACAYERPGVAAMLDDGLHPSRSDPVPMPRTAESVVDDLHALLVAAEIPEPYVLVGHSLGGLMVRLYAATYPDEVVGLVLVDAWYEGLDTLLTPEEWTAYVRLNSALPPEMATYANFETIDFNEASATMREAAEAAPLGQMPIFVLSHGQPFGLTEDELGFSPARLEAVWSGAQDELAMLVPDARHVVATESSHYIQLQQPELVIDAIREVVEAVRDPATWTDTKNGMNHAPQKDDDDEHTHRESGSPSTAVTSIDPPGRRGASPWSAGGGAHDRHR